MFNKVSIDFLQVYLSKLPPHHRHLCIVCQLGGGSNVVPHITIIHNVPTKVVCFSKNPSPSSLISHTCSSHYLSPLLLHTLLYIFFHLFPHWSWVSAINSVLWLLHLADVGNVANVSEVQYASIFDPEDAGSIHLQNVSNITHNHMEQQPQNRSNTNN